jgi:hypothetical protein
LELDRSACERQESGVLVGQHRPAGLFDKPRQPLLRPGVVGLPRGDGEVGMREEQQQDGLGQQGGQRREAKSRMGSQRRQQESDGQRHRRAQLQQVVQARSRLAGGGGDHEGGEPVRQHQSGRERTIPNRDHGVRQQHDQ